MFDTCEEKYYDSTAANFNLEQYCERRGLDPATVTDAKQVLMQEWREPALSFHNIQVRISQRRRRREVEGQCVCFVAKYNVMVRGSCGKLSDERERTLHHVASAQCVVQLTMVHVLPSSAI
jgi:hypothetical protein